MAREVHRREDLLRDARALSPRVKLLVGAGAQKVEVFAGFRGDSLSLYFGDDPVFHFNAQGELRRAFVAECLIKADGGALASMQRKRTADETALVSARMTSLEEQRLLDDLNTRLAGLRDALTSACFEVAGQEPPNGQAVERLLAWLRTRSAIAIASSPRVD